MPWLCLSQNSSMSLDGDMTLEEQDQDARVNYPVYDYNDNLCALIKVTVVGRLDSPLTLDVGSTLTVAERVERQDGEVWFYIPAEVKNLEFRCRSYEPIKMSVPLRLKGGNVYRVKIISHSSAEVIQNAVVAANYLNVDLFPADAVFSIGRTKDYEIYSQVPDDGKVTLRLDYGQYYYRVAHGFYETEEGVMNMGAEGIRKTISLKPAYSYMDIVTEPDGAKISVNGKELGTSPVSMDERVRKGEVRILAQKNLFYPCDTVINVPGDSLRHQVSLALKPQHGTVTLGCDDREAELWLDGVYLGVGEWNGPVSSVSSHVLEARKTGHRGQSISFKVSDGEVSEHTVAAPVPLYGTLDVSGEPSDASVSVDGEILGTAPFVFNQVLVGRHEVTVSKDGYVPYSETVSLEHNQHLNFSYMLEEGIQTGSLKVWSDVTGADITLEGPDGYYSYDRKTPYVFTSLVPGKYTVSLDKNRYKPSGPEQIFVIEGEEESIYMTMEKQARVKVSRQRLPQSGFAYHFVDLIGGYNFSDEQSFLLGAGYSYVKYHLGFYGSFLIGVDDTEDFTVSLGAVYRFTNDSHPVDFQAYAGPAYICGEIGADMGLRFGWKAKSSISWWDFAAGCQVSGSHVIPTLSVGFGISLSALAVLLGVYLAD